MAALTACSGPSDVGPAPSASSPACATALGAAPDTVLDQRRGPGGAAGTIGYGSPAVVVRCGLPPLAPTSDSCLSVDGVDWVLTSGQDGDPVVFATYGRAPALEVRVPASYGRENASVALVDVAPVARGLPSDGRACLG